MRTGKVLEEIRDLKLESQDVRRENQQILAEIREEARFTREVVRRNEIAFHELVAAIRELREESRSHTQAILALLDRLQGPGAAPAT